MTWANEDLGPAGDTYSDVRAWVTEWLAPRYRRQLGGQCTWCAQWHEHPEAVERLTLAWATWQDAAGDAKRLAAWWLGTLDPAMRLLLDADGPFHACRPDRHRGTPPLPVAATSAPPTASTA